jgi:hypothetical protein
VQVTSPDTTYGIDLYRGSIPRTTGTHLSGVLRKIALATGALNNKYGTDDLDDLIRRTPVDRIGATGQLMRLVVGYAWEDWIRKQIPGLIHQPGEFSLDGIIGTPDGIVEQDGIYILHEFKATWTSSSHPIQEHPMWLWQVMGYLAMMTVELEVACLDAVIHPLYVMGDYKNSGPLYVPVRLKFEPEEIAANWQLVLQFKDRATKEQ